MQCPDVGIVHPASDDEDRQPSLVGSQTGRVESEDARFRTDPYLPVLTGEDRGLFHFHVGESLTASERPDPSFRRTETRYGTAVAQPDPSLPVFGHGEDDVVVQPFCCAISGERRLSRMVGGGVEQTEPTTKGAHPDVLVAVAVEIIHIGVGKSAGARAATGAEPDVGRAVEPHIERHQTIYRPYPHTALPVFYHVSHFKVEAVSRVMGEAVMTVVENRLASLACHEVESAVERANPDALPPVLIGEIDIVTAERGLIVGVVFVMDKVPTVFAVRDGFDKSVTFRGEP